MLFTYLIELYVYFNYFCDDSGFFFSWTLKQTYKGLMHQHVCCSAQFQPMWTNAKVKSREEGDTLSPV